jgi:hypothetical protein
MIKTDVATAIIKLKEGHKVISVIDEKKYPLCPHPRKYEYNPNSEYSIHRSHVLNAEWYFE